MPHFDSQQITPGLGSYASLIQPQSELSWFHRSAADSWSKVHKWICKEYGHQQWTTSNTNLIGGYEWTLENPYITNTVVSCVNHLMGDPYDTWEQAGLLPVSRAAALQREAEVIQTDAKAKARALLKTILAPSEWTLYEQKGIIWVVGGKTGQRYLLRNSTRTRNVTCHDAAGNVIDMLCAHPDGVPIEDVLITQKLHLEHNEDGFRAVANITPAQLGLGDVRHVLSLIRP